MCEETALGYQWDINGNINGNINGDILGIYWGYQWDISGYDGGIAGILWDPKIDMV